MAQITIPLKANEKAALLFLAEQENRDPRQQAGLLIRQGLERAGLLKPIGADTSSDQDQEKYMEEKNVL